MASTALRKIIDSAIDASQTKTRGNIASPFYRSYDIAGNWVWAADVYLGDGVIINNVPVSSNNRDIIYSQQGKAVELTRLNNGNWSISGLSKVVTSSVHYLYITFREDTITLPDGTEVTVTIPDVTGDETVDIITRPLTYGELGSLAPSPGGYGILPYGVQGRFNADGSLIELVGW